MTSTHASTVARLATGAQFGVEGFAGFKGRNLYHARNVAVYRNLNEEQRTGAVLYSIRGDDPGEDADLVLGHACKLALVDARVHVNMAAQRRVASGQRRTVHAWVTGRLTFCPTDTSPWLAHARRVIYRPHEGPHFRYEDTDEVFVGTFGERVVRFDSHGMWAW